MTSYHPQEDCPAIWPSSAPVRFDCGIEVYRCRYCGQEVEGSDTCEHCRLEQWEKQLPQRVELAWRKANSALSQLESHGMTTYVMQKVLSGLERLLNPEPQE